MLRKRWSSIRGLWTTHKVTRALHAATLGLQKLLQLLQLTDRHLRHHTSLGMLAGVAGEAVRTVRCLGLALARVSRAALGLGLLVTLRDTAGTVGRPPGLLGACHFLMQVRNIRKAPDSRP